MIVNKQHYRTIWPMLSAGSGRAQVAILDQTQLPHEFAIVHIANLAQMEVAIKTMQVRGAPLIGAAAAYGLALAAQEDASEEALQAAAQRLRLSRPTAVNLDWALKRMLSMLLLVPQADRASLAWSEAQAICDEDVLQNQAIGQHGLALMQQCQPKSAQVFNVLTHCNAGWLATVDVGTALAPIYAAHDAGMAVHVWVDETRPRNQGASLTAWELAQHGVPHTVISDNAGGHLMQQGLVDMVLVGADRVSGQGDVCNKIGTYLKALAAFDNGLPFYAAVPSPTIDWSVSDALSEIEIEQRHGDEVAFIQGLATNGSLQSVRLVPSGSSTANPAFDVTPARLVTGIITERGVFSPARLLDAKRA
ncbi:MAG: S-methyl-5-thioribose-1-phosphate isomerase [Methylotenera sp.]|nr:S-methyl-5-thioribose-1-phosphate isomerase [Methylotenera sp.]